MHFARKRLARRVFEDLWGKGRLELIDTALHPAYRAHDAFLGELDREALRAAVQLFRQAFPDLSFDVEELIAHGRKVAVRWRASGTHRGPFLGAAPTGQRHRLTGMAVVEFRRGLVARVYSNWDALRLLRELGTVQLCPPAPAPAAALP